MLSKIDLKIGWALPGSIGLLVLAFHLTTFGVHPAMNGDDYVAYIANAQSLIAPGPYGMPHYLINPDYANGADLGQAAYPIGFPLLLAPIVWFAGSNLALLFTAAGLLSCVLLALFAGAFSRLAQREISPRAGLVAGLVAGFTPYLFDPGAFLAPSEGGFLFVLVLALMIDARFARTGRAGDAVWSGIAAGIAGMLRVVGVLLVPAIVFADLIRRRRITRGLLIVGAVGTVLTALGLLAMGQDYLARNAAIFGGGPHPQVTAAAADRLMPKLLHNLAALPGNLSVFWDYGWGATQAPGPWLHRAIQAISLLVLIGAGIGFVHRARGKLGATELFVILQTLMLLMLPQQQQSPRYYLPVSILVLFYLLAGAEFGRVARGRRFAAATLAIFAIMATSWPDALAVRADNARFNLLAPPATEMAAWIRANTPADVVILTHRPRSLVLLTNRTSSDFTSAKIDDRLRALVHATHARLLIASIDHPPLRDRAIKLGFGRSDAALNRALDTWEAEFFAGSGAAPRLEFRNSWYRIYRIDGL